MSFQLLIAPSVSVILASLLCLARPASADSPPFERFFGRFEGEAVVDARGRMSTRTTSVEIRPVDRGFTVKWVTVVPKPEGKEAQKAYSVKFKPTKREGIYVSAVRKDLFGKAVPNDPLKGEPFSWAKISGDKLTVYTLMITDSGEYEMQTNERTLTPDGIDLQFSRVRDGELVLTVTGRLGRVREPVRKTEIR